MTRVHDMGGRFGDGPVVPEPQGIAQFGADWHPRALAMTLAAGGLGQWNIDMSRRARENLSPKDYARFSYYEKWIAALADLLVETGTLGRDDLRTVADESRHPLSERALKGAQVASVLAKGSPADRPEGPAPIIPTLMPLGRAGFNDDTSSADWVTKRLISRICRGSS